MINKKRYFFTLFLSYVIVILVLTATLLAVSFGIIRKNYIDTLTSNLVHLNYTIEQSINVSGTVSDYSRLDGFIKELGHRINTRITMIDPEGVVLADSENDPKEMENHGDREEIRAAYNRKVGRNIRFSTTMKKKMLYVATPIIAGDRVIAVARTSLYLSDVENLLSTLRFRIFYITALLLIMVLIGVLIYSNKMYRPVRELVAAAEKISRNDFNVRVKIEPKSVFRYLAIAFNLMTETLQKTFAEISLQRDQLQTIIAAVPSDLYVIERNGQVILTNQKNDLPVGQPDAGDRHYRKVFQDRALQKFIDDAIKSGAELNEEIMLGQKTCLCSISRIGTTENTLLILHDITDIKNLQLYKKDFIANVSHELRTPLTAIKGFVETLQEDFTSTNKRYLDIINRHTDRLINIVNDLLILNEIEDTTQLEIEEIEPVKIRADLTKLFEDKLKQKGLRLFWEIPAEIPNLSADRFKLEQVFINLLDNAIKYTESGEIRVVFQQDGAEMVIEIEDTGIGIPADQLSRVFERFYTVDKSHSRRLGGTGLGLSIAKHIVLLHNGSINIASERHRGTKFTIRLPLKRSVN